LRKLMKSNPNGVGKRWSVGLGVDLTPVPSPSGEGSLSVDGAALFKQVWASLHLALREGA